MKRFVWLLLVMPFIVGALWAGGGSEEADREAVTKVLDDYGRYLMEGKIREWADLHSEDVVKMPPMAPVVFGSDTLFELNKDAPGQQKFLSWDLSIEELEIIGDRAYTWGLYSFELELTATGEVITMDGKFLSIYEKQPDGTWRFTHDCFNSNVPPSM